MYRIGEFSRIVNLTVKTLRYYDEENILAPSCRDESNGYRFYNEADYKKAEIIILLRRFDFSISEIKEVLGNYESQGDLAYYLAEKKLQLEDRIRDYQKLITALETYTTQTERIEKSMSYEIVTKTYEAMPVAALRYRGRYDESGKYFGRLFSVVKGKANGAPFNCYYDPDYKEDADIEACVPVKESVKGECVVTKSLPKIKAIVTTHKGSYDSIGNAYKALTDYAIANNIKCMLPSREIYLKGPGMIFKGNPDNYVTEVAMEIE